MNNYHRNFWIVLAVSALIISLLTIFATADSGMSLSARSAALYEPTTKTFLYSKNAEQKLPMASTTKIMTALIALECCELDEVVTVPKEAVGIEGSSLYLEEGEELTVKDLVYSVMLRSANDAATLLALKIGGDISGFANMMNEKAYALGLYDTHFDNPHGLDSEEHYTTAKDLARLAAAALENDSFKSICSTYKYSFNCSDKPRTVVNHNKLLKQYKGAIGVKTGFTKKSGRCLVSAAEREGITLVAVTLDAPSDWSDHTKLLDLGFSRTETVVPENLSNTVFNVPLINGSKETVRCELDNSGKVIVKLKNAEEVVATVELKKYIAAPVKYGEKVGKITYKQGETELCTLDILTAEEVGLHVTKRSILPWRK